MQSLFPMQRPGAGGMAGFGRAAEPAPLLSFKAGKMVLEADREVTGKFRITADKRRGKIEFAKGSDGLMHFRWIDRTSGRKEDDRIVFPDDIAFKRCKTGREEDRVYLLKFRGGQQPLMFWMQVQRGPRAPRRTYFPNVLTVPLPSSLLFPSPRPATSRCHVS
jgi:hypothetical protein